MQHRVYCVECDQWSELLPFLATSDDNKQEEILLDATIL